MKLMLSNEIAFLPLSLLIQQKMLLCWQFYDYDHLGNDFLEGNGSRNIAEMKDEQCVMKNEGNVYVVQHSDLVIFCCELEKIGSTARSCVK